ncbi:hypothetical protein SSX86_028211 [Deinandra increscens subsp. villosa]|uniref:Uncharacterized protein n=1 Tax=Deinandra increscens subsp. villosa TaxID=3103831 RepID=A0AAP0GKL0_9ASTR
MASPAPEKLQPLHNFLLTHLNWKNNRSGRSRLAGEAVSSSNSWLEPPPPLLRSHTHAPSSPHRRHTSPINASWRPSPPGKQSIVHDTEFGAIGRPTKSKISESSTKSVDYNNKRKRSNEISFRFGENSAADEGNHASTTDDSVPPKAADDESSPKTWNLRPRRLPVNHKQSTGGFQFPTIGTSSRLDENKTYCDINSNKLLSELNNNNYTFYNSHTRATELPRISIALSRGEIEEDVSFLTGSKPSKRPKKRPRAIQKQLDNLFPGLWLDSITVDSYKVSETPLKG